MTLATRCFAAISSTSELISAGVSAYRTVAPRAVAFFSKSSSHTSRLSSARLRIALPASRVASKSSSSDSDARRLATNFPCIFLRLPCSRSSCSLTCARSLKCIDATCMDRPVVSDAAVAPVPDRGRSTGPPGSLPGSRALNPTRTRPPVSPRRAAPWCSCRRAGAGDPRCSACSRDRPARPHPRRWPRSARTCCRRAAPRSRRT